MFLRSMSLLLLAVFLFLTSACAHGPAALDGSKEISSYRTTDPEPPAVVDQEFETIPNEMNPLVDQWVSYFQGRGRPHMERYLERSTRYIGLMKKILRQNGLPEDLIYIALIESGFSSRATSRAAAVGYWQFIKGTGRRYGLEINSMVDERRDPVLATQAAAEYFKGLYSVFGSWYLAMASYNAGENKIKREVMNNYTRDFWELARKKRLRPETINYVPKFIAARMIAKNPEKYGFTTLDYEKPIEFDLVKSDKPINLKTLATKMSIDYEDFKQLNPKFKGEIAPTKTSGYLELRVPVGQVQVAMNVLKDAAVEKVEYIADAGETQMYKVRPGDSLYTIARRYKTSVVWLRDTNDLQTGKKLRVGQRLQVPDKSSPFRSTAAKTKVAVKKTKPVDVAEAQEKAVENTEINVGGGTFYVVQPGDTLSSIAEDYDSSIRELRKMNKLSKSYVLKAGTKLRVPKDEGLPDDPNGARGPDSRVAASRGPDSTTDSHVVKAGENLTTIAKKYGVSVQALQKANNLNRRARLKVGARLVIPGGRKSSSVDSGARNSVVSKRSVAKISTAQQKKSVVHSSIVKAKKARVHIVRRGENLRHIAGRYNVTVGEIRDRNKIRDASKLFVGARLLIPTASANQ